MSEQVVFGIVSRNDLACQVAFNRVLRFAKNPEVCQMVGVSCIATARAMLASAIVQRIEAWGTECDGCVVLLDDDVEVTPIDLIAITRTCMQSGHVIVGTYPIRDADGAVSPDRRLAHRVGTDGAVYGGLGCIAIPIAVFLQVHKGEMPTRYLVSVHPSLPEVAPVYQATVLDGEWWTEDLFFFRVLRDGGAMTKLYPIVLRHAGRVADRSYRMLDGAPLPNELLTE